MVGAVAGSMVEVVDAGVSVVVLMGAAEWLLEPQAASAAKPATARYLSFMGDPPFGCFSSVRRTNSGSG